MLPATVASACTEMIEEQRRTDLLRAHALEPRHRVLLSGPPGNGKTSLAEAIAGELAVPLLVVRYDAVIGSPSCSTARSGVDFSSVSPSRRPAAATSRAA